MEARESPKALEELTPEQRATFQEFRTLMEEKHPDHPFCTDRCLLRYLRARQYNLKNAHEMLENTLTWRADYKPDQISVDDIATEAQTGKMYVLPMTCKDNRPIVVMRPGLDKPADRVLKVKYLVWIVEEAISKLRPEETGEEKITLLIDFTNAGMSMAGVESTKISIEVLNILQNHYPERLGKALLVNSPWALSAFWALIKPMLDPVTKAKLIFIKNKKNGEVHKYITPEALEADFEGTSSFKFNFDTWMEEKKQAQASA